MQIAEAFVAVRADADPARFKRDVERAVVAPAGAAGRRAGQEAGKGFSTGLSQGARSAAASLAGVFGTAVFARGVKGAIDAASALQEQVSGTGAIFADARGEIDTFAKAAAQSLGQSEVQARKSANAFGGLFRSFGISEQQSAQFSITLTTLASDLASLRDTPIEDAFLALQSGLVGEAEPLRRFGITLSEARLQQEALALGLTRTKGPLDAAAKSQAALSIILKDSKLAQGDFNRTRESAANTEKRAQAELANTSAQLGSNLLPAYQRLQQVIGTLANAFGVLPGSIQVGVVALAGLAVAARPIRDISQLFGGLTDKVGKLGETAPRTASAIRGIAVAGVAAGAVLALSQAIGSLDDEATASNAELAKLEEGIRGIDTAASEAAISEAIGRDLDSLADDVKTTFDTFKDASGVQEITEGANQLLGGLTGVESGAENARRRVGNLDKALASIASSNAPLAAQQFDIITAALREQGVTAEQLAGAFPEYEATLSRNKAATQDAAASNDVYNLSLGGTTDAAGTAAEQLQELADSLFSTSEAQLDAADAVANLRDAQTELAELQATAAGRGPEQAEALRRIADANRRVVDATEAHADAVRELQDARQELAEFESGGERRIRELEREQIVRRKVTTSDEARQKEIDLLRFDEQAGEERERLQDGIRTAEERVQDAAEGVEDAQRDVLEANKDRERQQVEAAKKITEAEREVERAALDIAIAYADIVAEQGAASQSALIYRDALTQAEPVLRRLIDLTAFLKAVQGATPGPAPLPTREQALDIARNKVGVGAFQTGGIVPGVGPQLAVVHGGEQILTAEQQRQGAVSINQSVTFVGGEIPSVTQLDALNRKTAIRVRNLGRRP